MSAETLFASENVLYVGTQDGSILVVNKDAEHIKTLRGHSSPVIAFQEIDTLYSLDQGGTLIRWMNGESNMTIHTPRTCSFLVLADGIVMVESVGIIHFFDLNGQPTLNGRYKYKNTLQMRLVNEHEPIKIIEGFGGFQTYIPSSEYPNMTFWEFRSFDEVQTNNKRYHDVNYQNSDLIPEFLKREMLQNQRQDCSEHVTVVFKDRRGYYYHADYLQWYSHNTLIVVAHQDIKRLLFTKEYGRIQYELQCVIPFRISDPTYTRQCWIKPGFPIVVDHRIFNIYTGELLYTYPIKVFINSKGTWVGTRHRSWMRFTLRSNEQRLYALQSLHRQACPILLHLRLRLLKVYMSPVDIERERRRDKFLDDMRKKGFLKKIE